MPSLPLIIHNSHPPRRLSIPPPLRSLFLQRTFLAFGDKAPSSSFVCPTVWTCFTKLRVQRPTPSLCMLTAAGWSCRHRRRRAAGPHGRPSSTHPGCWSRGCHHHVRRYCCPGESPDPGPPLLYFLGHPPCSLLLPVPPLPDTPSSPLGSHLFSPMFPPLPLCPCCYSPPLCSPLPKHTPFPCAI